MKLIQLSISRNEIPKAIWCSIKLLHHSMTLQVGKGTIAIITSEGDNW